MASRRFRQRAHARPWIDARDSEIDWDAVSADLRSRAGRNTPLLPQGTADGTFGAELDHQSPGEDVAHLATDGTGPSGGSQFEAREVAVHEDFLSIGSIGHGLNSRTRRAVHGYDLQTPRLKPIQQEPL